MLIHTLPPRRMRRLIAIRADSICRLVTYAGSSAWMPYSPKATCVPPVAMPLRLGWCCLRCLTLRGMSMAQLSVFSVVAALVARPAELGRGAGHVHRRGLGDLGEPAPRPRDAHRRLAGDVAGRLGRRGALRLRRPGRALGADVGVGVRRGGDRRLLHLRLRFGLLRLGLLRLGAGRRSGPRASPEAARPASVLTPVVPCEPERRGASRPDGRGAGAAPRRPRGLALGARAGRAPRPCTSRPSRRCGRRWCGPRRSRSRCSRAACAAAPGPRGRTPSATSRRRRGGRSTAPGCP